MEIEVKVIKFCEFCNQLLALTPSGIIVLRVQMDFHDKLDLIDKVLIVKGSFGEDESTFNAVSFREVPNG